MTSKLDSLKNGKHISFLLLASITFTYLSSFRLYINENIYKAFDLSNIGPIGRKLNVSVIIAVVMVLGWILGTITARFTSKKIKNNTTLYWMSSLFAIVALMFTPYNL